MPGIDGRITTHDGLELAYRLYGHGVGRPIVLLHGGGANLVSMDQWAERLDANRTVVSLDLRACGQSGDPVRFRWADAVGDIESLVESLGLAAVDIVGHSMGGFVAGFYATEHPGTRVVSIDGFGPGMPTIGDDNDRAAFAAFQHGMKAALWAMTEQPDEGDRSWRETQIDALAELFPQIGYTAPNARRMAERNLLDLGGGRFRRHPRRVLFEGGFADGGDRDILRMYRRVQGPTLIVRCTESGAPPVLDAELDMLEATNPHVEVVRLPLTHLAPAWDAIDEVANLARDFLARPTK